MKKVKIMLTSLAILAVVGGALAFKAKNFSGTVYCATQANQNANASGALCPAFTPSTYTISGIGTSFCTITANTPCAQKSLVPVPSF